MAHFLLSALLRQPISIYGDGCQVRDVLYVDDLTDAMLLASRNAEACPDRPLTSEGVRRIPSACWN